MTDRERVLNVRLSDDEMQMVKELAAHVGLSQSDAVRQLIRKAYSDAGLGSGKRRKK
jgi:predicted DNA binding CopG/RHH family protein